MDDVFTISENTLDKKAVSHAVTRLKKSNAYVGIEKFSKKTDTNKLLTRLGFGAVGANYFAKI